MFSISLFKVSKNHDTHIPSKPTERGANAIQMLQKGIIKIYSPPSPFRPSHHSLIQSFPHSSLTTQKPSTPTLHSRTTTSTPPQTSPPPSPPHVYCRPSGIRLRRTRGRIRQRLLLPHFPCSTTLSDEMRDCMRNHGAKYTSRWVYIVSAYRASNAFAG
jgi:hypothetical protein